MKTQPSTNRKTKALIEIPVKFGRPFMTKNGLSIHLTIARGDLPLDKAGEFFCARRLHGSMLVCPPGIMPRDEVLPGMESHLTSAIVADVESFTANASVYSAVLVLRGGSIDLELFGQIGGRFGWLGVEGACEIGQAEAKGVQS